MTTEETANDIGHELTDRLARYLERLGSIATDRMRLECLRFEAMDIVTDVFDERGVELPGWLQVHVRCYQDQNTIDLFVSDGVQCLKKGDLADYCSICRRAHYAHCTFCGRSEKYGECTSLRCERMRSAVKGRIG